MHTDTRVHPNTRLEDDDDECVATRKMFCYTLFLFEAYNFLIGPCVSVYLRESFKKLFIYVCV